MMTLHRINRSAKNGFSLVELAVVLIVVSLLLVGLLGPLTAQQEQKNIMDARRQMDEAREAIFGFLVSNGRLPCPANPTLASANAAAGIERVGGCAGANSIGVLPWRTLGLREADPWGNRFTYRVTDVFADPTKIAAKSIGFGTNGDLTLWATATPPTPISQANEVVAILVSHGHHADGAWTISGAQLPASADADEAQNSDGDQTFVDHRNTAELPNSAYDDLTVWVPRNLVFNRLMTAGRLP